MMHYSLPICHTHNITLLRYADDTTLTAESEEELKSQNEDHGIWSHHNSLSKFN